MPVCIFCLALIYPGKICSIIAIRDGDKSLALFDMWKEHGWRMPLPDLYRMNVNIPVMRINIQQHLRSVLDLGNRFERVTASKEGEVGHGIQFEQVGAGYLEKISDHAIGSPGQKQIRKTIKHVKNIRPRFRE